MIPVIDRATSVAVNIKKLLDFPFIVKKVELIKSDLRIKIV
jgi:hypothetical protein